MCIRFRRCSSSMCASSLMPKPIPIRAIRVPRWGPGYRGCSCSSEVRSQGATLSGVRSQGASTATGGHQESGVNDPTATAQRQRPATTTNHGSRITHPPQSVGRCRYPVSRNQHPVSKTQASLVLVTRTRHSRMAKRLSSPKDSPTRTRHSRRAEQRVHVGADRFVLPGGVCHDLERTNSGATCSRAGSGAAATLEGCTPECWTTRNRNQARQMTETDLTASSRPTTTTTAAANGYRLRPGDRMMWGKIIGGLRQRQRRRP